MQTIILGSRNENEQSPLFCTSDGWQARTNKVPSHVQQKRARKLMRNSHEEDEEEKGELF
jgi:hypothetical protein